MAVPRAYFASFRIGDGSPEYLAIFIDGKPFDMTSSAEAFKLCEAINAIVAPAAQENAPCPP